jgi:hypothetical protein
MSSKMVMFCFIEIAMKYILTFFVCTSIFTAVSYLVDCMATSLSVSIQL